MTTDAPGPTLAALAAGKRSPPPGPAADTGTKTMESAAPAAAAPHIQADRHCPRCGRAHPAVSFLPPDRRGVPRPTCRGCVAEAQAARRHGCWVRTNLHKLRERERRRGGGGHVFRVRWRDLRELLHSYLAAEAARTKDAEGVYNPQKVWGLVLDRKDVSRPFDMDNAVILPRAEAWQRWKRGRALGAGEGGENQ